MSASAHRHIENPDEIAWYRVKFPDKGSGATRAHAYVQGDSEEAVRAIAADHEHFEMYDTSKGTVTRVGPLWYHIADGFKGTGGPNVLIDQLGNIKHRSDH